MNRYACRAFRRRRPRHQEVYIAGIRRSSSCNCVATSAQAPGCSEAQTKYTLSADLIQLRLTQFDHDELNTEEAEADAIAEYEAKIAALERKSGQLTMELELVKKTPRLRLVNDNEKSRIITGPKPAPSDKGAK